VSHREQQGEEDDVEVWQQMREATGHCPQESCTDFRHVVEVPRQTPPPCASKTRAITDAHARTVSHLAGDNANDNPSAPDTCVTPLERHCARSLPDASSSEVFGVPSAVV
jgi:hypothetical protein